MELRSLSTKEQSLRLPFRCRSCWHSGLHRHPMVTPVCSWSSHHSPSIGHSSAQLHSSLLLSSSPRRVEPTRCFYAWPSHGHFQGCVFPRLDDTGPIHGAIGPVNACWFDRSSHWTQVLYNAIATTCAFCEGATFF
jgi:hypothetical protein